MTNEIFGRDADKIVRAFLDSVHLGQNKYQVGCDYVEGCVILGYIVAANNPTYFVESGCGLGILSLTLSKMGLQGEAYDIEPSLIQEGKALAATLGINLNYNLQDFNEWNSSLPSGSFMIVDKPRGGLELVVLSKAISTKCNLALVPPYNLGETSGEILATCESYMRALMSQGYHAESVALSETLPLRVVLGTTF